MLVTRWLVTRSDMMLEMSCSDRGRFDLALQFGLARRGGTLVFDVIVS